MKISGEIKPSYQKTARRNTERKRQPQNKTSHQAVSVDCLAQWDISAVFDPRTQRCIASRGIQPGPSDLSITNLMLYQLSYRSIVSS